MTILRIFIFCVVSGSLFLVACGGSSAPKIPMEVFVPDWYADVTEDESFIYFYGSSEKVSKSASESGAHADALAEAACYVESHFHTMKKNFILELNLETDEAMVIVEKPLKRFPSQKTHIAQMETIIVENDRYKSFIQVAISKVAITKAVIDRIKQDDDLYSLLKASQTFKELERTVTN